MSGPAPQPAGRGDRRERIRGLLLGTALGDALGLPMEGLSGSVIRRRFGEPVERFHLLGSRGYVSDDTEQAALVCQAIARGRGDLEATTRALRWSLIGWLWRLPFAVGLSTLRACLGLSVGRATGVCSAGNGAMMRAPVLAAVRSPKQRKLLGRQLARLTHTDDRGVQGALFAAELAAACLEAPSDTEPRKLVLDAMATLPPGDARDAVQAGLGAASSSGPFPVEQLGNSGFVIHTLALTSFAFTSWGADPLVCVQRTVALGGDTDTAAAIVGAWCGALHGEQALPSHLIAQLQGGPFGAAHLRALGDACVDAKAPPGFPWPLAMLRNLALYPVVLAHGLRRLWPR